MRITTTLGLVDEALGGGFQCGLDCARVRPITPENGVSVLPESLLFMSASSSRNLFRFDIGYFHDLNPFDQLSANVLSKLYLALALGH